MPACGGKIGHAANTKAVPNEDRPIRGVNMSRTNTSFPAKVITAAVFIAVSLPIPPARAEPSSSTGAAADGLAEIVVTARRFFRNGLAATYTQGLTQGLDLKLVGAYRDGHGRQFIDFEELDANLFQVPAQYSEHQ